MEFAWRRFGENFTPKMPDKRQVLGLRVSSDSNQGGRAYMEDMVSIRYERRKDNDCAFFGVFDGHGGREAAVFARDMLWDTIKTQRGFESKDPEKVKQAINDGFLKTQEAMWKKRSNWGQTKSGYPSTSGTTACIAIIRGRQMWVAHVGDSRAVLGVMSQRGLKSRTVTVDHKPESPKEIKRIEAIGGKIQAKNGVQRVVWERTKLSHSGPVRRSTCVDQIPFLAVARSLGDLWSYSTLHNDYLISPKPDISHLVLDPRVHQCLIIGSDGLWNMMSSHESIYILSMYNFEKRKGEKMRETMAQRLVKNSINRWVLRSLRADNTTAITITFDFPKEKPKASPTASETGKSGTAEKGPNTDKEEVKSCSPTTSKEEASTKEDAKVCSSPISIAKEEGGANQVAKPCSSSTSKEEASVKEEAKVCSPSSPKEEASGTPDSAKATTSPESKKEEEEVGTKLRIRGETDFVGVQGFGSETRPKLRRSNAYRDFTFRFHYPEPEEEDRKNVRWWEVQSKKRKASDDEDEESDHEESWNKKWRLDGDTYINTPLSEISDSKRHKRKHSSSPSPWLSPEEVNPSTSSWYSEGYVRKKCTCYDCRSGMPGFCTRPYEYVKKPKKSKPTVEIVYDLEENPESPKKEECKCFECTHGVPQFCSAAWEGKCDPISDDDDNPYGPPKNCKCFECKHGIPEFCTAEYMKPRRQKKKVDSSFKQTRYNTRNSPTEPEVPLAQRALRSLNKSATKSPTPKKLCTPAKKRINGRHRSIKSC